MKGRILSLIALALAMVLAVPAHAQPPIAPIEFRLTVTVACPDATYYGLVGVPNSEGFDYGRLTDPDGDGVFTTSGYAVANEPLPVLRLIQGTGTKIVERSGSRPVEVPGDPSRVIRDFGTPTLAENQQYVFEGTVSSCIGAALPPTGVSDNVPTTALVGGVMLLAAGAYVQRRMWRTA